jgi:hypothetical protein
MHTQIQRPNRRPKLYLPLALVERSAEAPARTGPLFPLGPDLLRRTVAEMIG